MDNLPKDPSNQNSNNNPTPQPFGSDFNPHTNPIDPNNPYQTQPDPIPPPPQTPPPNTPNPPKISKILSEAEGPDALKHEHYSEAAQEKPRDEHGRFKSESSQASLIPERPDQNPLPISQITPTPPNPSPSSNPPTPLPITISENTKYSAKIDPPLFNISVIFTNPVTYLKNFLSRFLKNQDIDLRLRIKPFATIGLVIAFGLVGGTAFSIGRYLFPNSSPILHRQVVYPGVVQKGEAGQYYLMSYDSTLWKLKPKINNIKLSDLVDKRVVVTGNLTSESHLIEVSEVIVSETNPQPITPASQNSPNSPNTPNLPNIPDQNLLPKLYSGITWETNQKKILTFTSGRRRIEQEGVYLESARVLNLPQDFINYYTNQLTNLGFKQTLNSKDPDGTIITYSKDELFLTFGIKNIFSGTGDNKKIMGYRAYIEHN